jgi:hypothetical protein
VNAVRVTEQIAGAVSLSTGKFGLKQVVAQNIVIL